MWKASLAFDLSFLPVTIKKLEEAGSALSWRPMAILDDVKLRIQTIPGNQGWALTAKDHLCPREEPENRGPAASLQTVLGGGEVFLSEGIFPASD